MLLHRTIVPPISEEGPFNVTSCSAMTCNQTFNLPRNFSDGKTRVDLGRNVHLKMIDVLLRPMNLSFNASINLTLTLSISYELLTGEDPCLYIPLVDNFNFRFDCFGQLGRYLDLVVDVIDSKDNTTTYKSGKHSQYVGSSSNS